MSAGRNEALLKPRNSMPLRPPSNACCRSCHIALDSEHRWEVANIPHDHRGRYSLDAPPKVFHSRVGGRLCARALMPSQYLVASSRTFHSHGLLHEAAINVRGPGRRSDGPEQHCRGEMQWRSKNNPGARAGADPAQRLL